MSRGLAEERETSNSGEISRTDGDCRFGLFATGTSLLPIGIEPASGAGEERTGRVEYQARAPDQGRERDRSAAPAARRDAH